MNIPRPKRGWHIAKKGEYCLIDNTALYLGDRWDYDSKYGGYQYRRCNLYHYPIAIRNHPKKYIKQM